MSAKSTGLWVIKGPVENIVAAWIACRFKVQLPPNEPKLWEYFTTYQKHNVGYIRLQYIAWVWYDSFQDVRFFEKVWKELANFDTELSGRRIRISKDQNGNDAEIEDLYFGEDCPDIHSTINDNEHSSGEPLNQTKDTTCSRSSAN